MKYDILRKMKYVFSMLVLGIVLFSQMIVYAASNENREIVRVGFFSIDGYHEMLEDGIRSGYGYEFLQKIAGYTNFEYEYIGYGQSWNEMLEMLDNGEIDILTSAQYTEERAEKYDYSEFPIGYSEAILTTNTTQDKIIPGDYDTYENMRVGMLESSAQNEKMFQFAQKHDFQFEAVYFFDYDQLYEALQEGIVDAAVTTSSRVLGKEIVLERFDRAPYYVIVKKGNTDLLDKVNYAINKLNICEYDWMSNLHEKYYAVNEAHIYLAPEERTYLNGLTDEQKIIRVLVNPDLKPYSYNKNGEVKGILVDYFDKICSLYGLSAEYIQVESAEEYVNAARDHKADMVLEPCFLQYEADTEGYYLTQDFLATSFCLIEQYGEKEKENYADEKIAVVTGVTSVEQAGRKDFPDAEFVFYATTDDCIKALKKHKVDGVLLYSYTAYEYLNQDWENKIKIHEIPDNYISFSIAISKDCNPMMYALMNDAINMIPDSEIEEIVLPTILEQNESEESVWEYLRKRQKILKSLVVVMIVFFGVMSFWYLAHQKSKRKRAENQACHDALTGAYNRFMMDWLLHNPSELSSKVGMLILDVDYFKDVNDNYGHAIGDQVLKKIVTLLESQSRGNDFILRIGGDEFMMILQDCDASSWEVICEKLQHVQEVIMEDFPEKMALSFSAGLCFSEKGVNDEMMKICDRALYYTKEQGRAGCTLADEQGDIIKYWKNSQKDYSSKLVLEKHQLKSWKLIVEADGTRKLHTKEELCECLDIPTDTKPEEIYRRWYEQIPPNKIEKFDEMFANMKNGNCTEMVIHCEHPKKGLITIRFTGEKSGEEDGQEIYTGYYQILNGIHILQE